MCLTLPKVLLISSEGIEKIIPTWQDFEVFAAAAALLDGRAWMNPLHLVLDRRASRRRAAGVPPGAARQRAHQQRADFDRPPDAQLHPLQRLPEHLPDLRAHGRARPMARSTPARSARSRRCSWWASSRPARCPTPRRSAAPATMSARSRSTSPRCWSTCAPAWCATSRRQEGLKGALDPEGVAMKRLVARLRQPQALRAGAAAGRAWASCPSPDAARSSACRRR